MIPLPRNAAVAACELPQNGADGTQPNHQVSHDATARHHVGHDAPPRHPQPERLRPATGNRKELIMHRTNSIGAAAHAFNDGATRCP